MANKYEVVEMEKNTWNEDGSPSITNRWPCESETDALINAHARKVGAEIEGRTDVCFDALEDGEPIDRAGHGNGTSTAAAIKDREATMRSGLHSRVILGETN